MASQLLRFSITKTLQIISLYSTISWNLQFRRTFAREEDKIKSFFLNTGKYLSPKSQDFIKEICKGKKINIIGKSIILDYINNATDKKKHIIIKGPPGLKYQVFNSRVSFEIYDIKKRFKDYDEFYQYINEILNKRVIIPKIQILDSFISDTLEYTDSILLVIRTLSKNKNKKYYNEIITKLKTKFPGLEDFSSANSLTKPIVIRFLQKGGLSSNYLKLIDRKKIKNHNFSQYVKFCKEYLDLDIG